MTWDFLFMKPKIKFKLNKTLDKKMAFEFLNIKQGGVDFSRGIIDVHPELKIIKEIKDDKQKKKLINRHFDFFYKKHITYLKNQTVRFNKEWIKSEIKFFNKTKKIFKNNPWPKGKYIGYLSIIDCNPRFLKDKTFQIFYFHPQGIIYVTMHELLHFIFYEYAIKKHYKTFKKLNTETGIFWDLAEIFNAIILSLPEFIKLHKQKNIFSYPQHKKYLPKLKKLWQETKDIDEWLIEGYKFLKIIKNK